MAIVLDDVVVSECGASSVVCGFGFADLVVLVVAVDVDVHDAAVDVVDVYVEVVVDMVLVVVRVIGIDI